MIANVHPFHTVVIDAGHGGHDSGTLGVDGIEEKDVVLDVVRTDTTRKHAAEMLQGSEGVNK